MRARIRLLGLLSVAVAALAVAAVAQSATTVERFPLADDVTLCSSGNTVSISGTLLAVTSTTTTQSGGAVETIHFNPHGISGIDATTGTLYRAVGREIRLGYQAADGFIGGELFDTRLELATDWFALGLSTDRPDRFQGHHAEHLLLVGDEASGIEEAIYEAAAGFMTSPMRVRCSSGIRSRPPVPSSMPSTRTAGCTRRSASAHSTRPPSRPSACRAASSSGSSRSSGSPSTPACGARDRRSGRCGSRLSSRRSRTTSSFRWATWRAHNAAS
jgi:hypothetical protein